MKLPELNEIPVSREMVSVFKGYNHNLRIDDGEFYEMENMVSDHYPVLSPRGKRGTYAAPEDAQGLIAKDALCYVDGSGFVINGYRVEMGLSVSEEDCPKSLISMGAYVIILPDKKYINTADLTDFGKIEARFTTANPVTFTLCTVDGADYELTATGDSEPEDPENMALWLDTSSTPHTLKQWSESSGMWVSIATTYIKIQSAGIGKAFEQYDGIRISGLKDVELVDSTTGNVIDDTEQLQALEGAAVVWEKDDDYIVVIGILDVTRTISNEITISREMPVMDFVTESENRLWGCRYGPDKDGNVVNEIYACKLGDFRNWNCFMSLSTDSYVVSLGSDGQFTGAVTHLGYPLFFKENCLHKIYGNYPANYQVQTTACRGVQKGCDRSLAIVNEVLYYKARSGVCAYDGSLPEEVSAQLGQEKYSDAVAGALGNKLYIAMKDSKGKYPLFVYDTARGMWHKEEHTPAMCFCACDGELYYIDRERGEIRTVLGSGTVDRQAVKWSVETGDLGVEQPDRQYISRLTVRLSMGIGSRIRIYARYDSAGGWENLAILSGTSLRTVSVPVRPRRCDHLRLRIEGTGEAKVYSITKNIEYGSEE